MTVTQRTRVVRNTVLWTVAGGAVLIGVIFFVGAYGEDVDGGPILETPAALLSGAITSFGLLLSVLLPIVLNTEKKTESAEKAAKVIVDQVQNSHRHPDGSPFLLRDDMDSKHDVLMDKVGSIADDVKLAIDLSRDNAADIRGMRKDVGRVQDVTTENTRALDNNLRVTSGLIKTVTSLEAKVSRHHPEGES